MNILEETIKDYKDLDPRIILYLEHVVNEIGKDKVTDYTKVILGMLVPQLIIYYRSLDELNTKNDLTNENKYYGKSKSPVIIIMQKANDQILNLLDKISLSPMTKAKIKKLNTTEENTTSSGEKVLNKLIG